MTVTQGRKCYKKWITATAPTSAAFFNPFRYRGYYYDTDTGLYYLQSRYYDPAVGRFLNADSLVSTGTGVLGNNMFAYCNNSPVIYVDSFGRFPQELIARDRIFAYESDSRFFTVRIPAPSVLGPIEKPQDPEPGTKTVGITGSASYIIGIGASFGFTYDKGGNMGFIVSVEGIGCGMSAGAGVFETNMNCSNIYDQEKGSFSIGGALSAGCLGASIDYVHGLTDDLQFNEYYGYNKAVTFGVGMPGEVHGAYSYSWVFCDFNIYDVWNDFYAWIT